MLYRVYTPTPELADLVISYWCAFIPPNSESTQQYPTPLFECMVFNFAGLKEYQLYEGKITYMTKTAYVFGQTKSCSTITGSHKNGGYIIGVRFKPLGLARLTGINMVHLAGRVVDAEDIWGNKLEWLFEAMQEADSVEAAIAVLECFFKEQRRNIRLHDRVRDVEQAITLMKEHQGNISCKALQHLTNTTRKTLERTFLNFHGMPPKAYIRIIRFNRAKLMLDHDPALNLTKLAHNLGYFDQAHFIKEFNIFSGQTHTGYLKSIEMERLKRTIPVD
jgi:AraC-like DNA-binding protein